MTQSMQRQNLPTTNYRWALRKAIGRRLPLSVRKRVMSVYHGAFLRFDRMADVVRLSLTWRGQSPRVYLPTYKAALHPGWGTYLTQPPLRYAPMPLAELCHWINLVPDRPAKPCVAECEHILALAGDITNWQTGLRDTVRINRLVAQPECRFVFTYSAGLVEHSRRYLSEELWPKLSHVYPAYPDQPGYEPPPARPFTVLTIASRFSDKGVPEALEAYRVLRERHGPDVRMTLVSQALPPGLRLPEGVTLYDTPRMSDGLRRFVYQSAHVLFIPCYSDTAGCFPEACAFSVPILTTRIHHGDEFVRDGSTGYLITPPVYSYSEDYGVRWKTWDEFLADLDVMRQRGDFRSVVDQSVDRLEAMFSGMADLPAMRRATKALHAEQFSLERRNQRLLRIYQAALAGDARFPD